jgi:hypothetical protein
MSLSHEAEHDEQVMTRYFLGLLPAEEAERLDEQSIADAELARRLRVVEHDLVDAYVRGTLDSATRAQFERAYLTSARRREKVRFAESLRRAVDRSGVQPTVTSTMTPTMTPTPTPTATPAPAPAAVRRARFNLQLGSLAFAFAAILLLVTGALLFQAIQLRQQLSTALSERAALDRRTQELQQQLNDQIAAKTEASRELDRMRAVLSDAMQRAVGRAAALALSPQTRSIATVPALRITPDAENAAFKLLLEANAYPRYQVALRDPGTNAILWRSEPIAASPSGREGPSVPVVVPGRMLKTQHYSLDLSGINASGGSELLGSYAFRAVTR